MRSRSVFVSRCILVVSEEITRIHRANKKSTPCIQAPPSKPGASAGGLPGKRRANAQEAPSSCRADEIPEPGRRHTYCAASTLLSKEWASCCVSGWPVPQDTLIFTEPRGGHQETCPERRRAGAVPRHSLRRETQVLGKGERQPGEMMKPAQVGLMRCRPRRACMLAAGRASGEGSAPAGSRSRLHNMPTACAPSGARVRRRPRAAVTHPALLRAQRKRTDPGSWLRAQHDEQAGPDQQHCTTRGRPQREPCAPFVTFVPPLAPCTARRRRGPYQPHVHARPEGMALATAARGPRNRPGAGPVRLRVAPCTTAVPRLMPAPSSHFVFLPSLPLSAQWPPSGRMSGNKVNIGTGSKNQGPRKLDYFITQFFFV